MSPFSFNLHYRSITSCLNMQIWRWVILTGCCLLIFSSWLVLKRHLEYVSLERLCHASCLASRTQYLAVLQQFYQQDPSDPSFENHVTCQGLSETFKKKKCFTVLSTFLHLSFVSFKVRGTLNVSYVSCSRTGLMGTDTNQRAFTDGQDT